MPTHAPVPLDHPLMIAWNAYKQTGEFANTRGWATTPAHTEGSLWAAFERGFAAAGCVSSNPPVRASEGSIPEAVSDKSRADLESLSSQITTLREALEKIERATKPFADFYFAVSNNLRRQAFPSSVVCDWDGDVYAKLMHQDFRALDAARTALSETNSKEGMGASRDPRSEADAATTATEADSGVASTRARVLADITAERQRQIAAEGWTPEHDDEHDCDQMAFAAACYAAHGDHRALSIAESKIVPHHYEHNGRAQCDDLEWYPVDRISVPRLWPWDGQWWKPRDRRANLVRAAALIVAEIERLDRKATPCVSSSEQDRPTTAAPSPHGDG